MKDRLENFRGLKLLMITDTTISKKCEEQHCYALTPSPLTSEWEIRDENNNKKRKLTFSGRTNSIYSEGLEQIEILSLESMELVPHIKSKIQTEIGQSRTVESLCKVLNLTVLPEFLSKNKTPRKKDQIHCKRATDYTAEISQENKSDSRSM